MKDTREDKFNALRAAYIKQRERSGKVEADLRQKYHVPWDGVLYSHDTTKTEQAKRDAAWNAVDKASEKFMAHLDAISPRNWREGVPAHWVYEELTFADAIRPKDQKLSVIPPLAYGYTCHKT